MVEWKKFLLKSKSHRDSKIATSFDTCETMAESGSGSESGLAPRTNPPVQPASIPAPSIPQDLPRNKEDLLPDDIRNYYYPDLDMDSARRLLQSKSAGTFLLRHSQCPNALYTLSVKSEKHVFNVRIFKRLEASGGYHLDAPKHLRKCFPTISELLRHYSNSPRELIALCSSDGVDEKTTFRLMYPLSKSESTLNLAAPPVAASGEENGESSTSRPVTRQMNGGSLKAMVKWL